MALVITLMFYNVKLSVALWKQL